MAELSASLYELQQKLQQALPAYTYQLVAMQTPSYLLIRKSWCIGAEVRIKSGVPFVSYSLPALHRFMSMQQNALVPLVIRLFVRNAFEPVQQVKDYLRAHFMKVSLHLSNNAS